MGLSRIAFIAGFLPSKDPEPLQCLVCRGGLWPPKDSADGPTQLQGFSNDNNIADVTGEDQVPSKLSKLPKRCQHKQQEAAIANLFVA